MSSREIHFRVNNEVYSVLEDRGAAMRISASQYARLLLLLGSHSFSDLDVRRLFITDREERRRAKRAQNQQQREADAY